MVSNSTTSQFSLMPLKTSTNQCNKISQIFGIYPCSNPRSNLIFLLISNHLMSSCLDNIACFSFLVEIWVSCITIAKGPLDYSFTLIPHLGRFSFFSSHQPNVSNLIIIFLKHLIFTNDLFSLTLAHEVSDLFRTILHHKLI